MHEFLVLTTAFTAGVLLGAVFFGGLWWTVVRGLSSPQPALWFFPSLLLRTGILVAGFYWVGREYWDRWLLCLIGFVLARILIRWLTGSPAKDPVGLAKEVNCAP